MPRSKRLGNQNLAQNAGDDEDTAEFEPLVDTTASLQLHSRRTERMKRKHRKQAEKQALSPKVISDLPYELLIRILSFLRPSDVFVLLRVSKLLRQFVLREQTAISRGITSWRYPCLHKCFQLPVAYTSLTQEEASILSLARQRHHHHHQPRGVFQHVEAARLGSICECVTCRLRWLALNIVVDFAHWQPSLDKGEPIPMIGRGQAPTWNAELIARNASLVMRAMKITKRGEPDDDNGGPLWYARILEMHLASTIRSIRRHAANKGNKRRRFRLTTDDEAAGTDAFLERSGPPTVDNPFHRDNYYMLEAYLPCRSWSSDLGKWIYVPADQHSRDIQYMSTRMVDTAHSHAT